VSREGKSSISFKRMMTAPLHGGFVIDEERIRSSHSGRLSLCTRFSWAGLTILLGTLLSIKQFRFTYS